MTGCERLGVTLLLALVTTAVGAALAPPALGGGTIVYAPRDLTGADCAQGALPRAGGYMATPVAPTVIGCAGVAGGEVMVAADHDAPGRRGSACFYTVPAGGSEVDGPCSRAKPETPMPAPAWAGVGGSSRRASARTAGLAR